ncbi:MAG: hypothetical protein E7496_10135 [Ruminococcus sp.]|nr:hypothetical protein [Ruminococcus sp.]
MMLEKRIFDTGEFVIWKNQIYRSKTYQKDYELFHLKDKNRNTPLCRIDRNQAEDAYRQFAYCELKGLRYRAVSVQDEFCEYQPFYPDFFFRDRIEDMTEIWIQKNRSGQKPEIETVWLRPYCMNPPSSHKFYVQKRPDMKFMLCWPEERLTFRKAVQCLKEYYQERISVLETDVPFWDTYIQKFQIDRQNFIMTLDFGLVDITPEEKDGNPYLLEIVKYFNSFS